MIPPQPHIKAVQYVDYDIIHTDTKRFFGAQMSLSIQSGVVIFFCTVVMFSCYRYGEYEYKNISKGRKMPLYTLAVISTVILLGNAEDYQKCIPLVGSSPIIIKPSASPPK